MENEAVTIGDVHISKATLEENPQFARLMRQLKGYLAEDGGSAELARHVVNLEQQVETIKEQVMELTLLLEEAETQVAIAPADMKATQQVLTSASCSQLLTMRSSDGSWSLFGLSESDFRVNDELAAEASREALDRIGNALARRLLALYNAWNPKPQGRPSRDELVLAKAQQLPSQIRAQRASSAEKAAQIQHLERARHRSWCELLDTTLDCLDSTEQLLNTYRFDTMHKHTNIQSRELLAKASATRRKLRLTILAMMCDVYNGTSLPQLQKTRDGLLHNLEDYRARLDRASAQLQAFAGLGSTFQNVAEDYAMLGAEIDSKRWAFHQLQETKP